MNEEELEKYFVRLLEEYKIILIDGDHKTVENVRKTKRNIKEIVKEIYQEGRESGYIEGLEQKISKRVIK